MGYYITMPVTAIIGGSGLYEMDSVDVTDERLMKTPYGEPSAPILIGRMGGAELAFLPRHGLKHSIAPHKVNYRANIWALREVGVGAVVAVAAVGGLVSRLWTGPGD